MTEKQRGRDAGLYDDLFDAEEQERLAAAARLAGVDAELAVLRVLVRRVLAAGNLREARLLIETIGRLVRARRALEADEGDQTTDLLGKVLDQLAAELDVPR